MTEQEVLNAVKDIPTYILDDDIRLYYKYMLSLQRHSLAVDVGTGLAKSAIALALSNPWVQVLTFDTGIYPLDRKWAPTITEYQELINNRLDFHAIKNVKNLLEDIVLHKFEGKSIDLLHVDGEKEVEEEILEYMLPAVKDGGILLIRNVDRFSNKGNNILKTYGEKLEKRGKIIVYKKL